MTVWHGVYIVTGLSSLIFALVLTEGARRLAWRLGFLDRPLGEHHKRHSKATPLMGGLAMLLAWLLTLGAGLATLFISPSGLPDELAHRSSGVLQVLPLLGVIVGGAVALTAVGLIDDRRPLGPFRKLILQVLICGIAALYPELRITLFWRIPILTWLFTLGWLLFIINSLNFFDNMDGLASGTAVIAAVLFAVVAAIRQQFFVATLASATAGAALGFYWHNRYPARIFMGDAGSHFLGFLLGVLGALTVFYDPDSNQTVAALLVPVFILALPVFDTFAVVFIRLHQGRPIYHGDHNHISHRFVRMGVNRRTAVFVVHLLALALGLGALTLLWLQTRGAILVLIQAAAILTLISILHQTKPDERNQTHDD